jgi:hypothetical protein
VKILNFQDSYGLPSREWRRDDKRGTHVPLPLDPAQFDAKGAEAAEEELLMELTDQYTTEGLVRAVLAAYAQAVASQ